MSRRRSGLGCCERRSTHGSASPLPSLMGIPACVRSSFLGTQNVGVPSLLCHFVFSCLCLFLLLPAFAGVPGGRFMSHLQPRKQAWCARQEDIGYYCAICKLVIRLKSKTPPLEVDKSQRCCCRLQEVCRFTRGLTPASVSHKCALEGNYAKRKDEIKVLHWLQVL